MARDHQLSRRSLLIGAASSAALLPASALAQVTDLRGWDPLWRNAEDAIRAFFGDVTYQSEGLELELPEHADVGSSVPLTIRVVSAMTEADYPRVVHVLAHGNPTPHVLSAYFRPAAGKAEFQTRIRLEQSQKVTAVVQMSDGRHIRVDRQISVSFGACAQIGTGGNDEIASFIPQSRVSVPPAANAGSIIPVRAVISHPMETGMRLDGKEEWVRQRILSNFECQFNGAPVFRVRLHPAVATNPYFLFFARVSQSGTFEFSWYDIIDVTYRNRATISVSG